MVANHTCHSDVSAEVIHHGNIEDPISLVTVDTVSNYLAVVMKCEGFSTNTRPKQLRADPKPDRVVGAYVNEYLQVESAFD